MLIKVMEIPASDREYRFRIPCEEIENAFTGRQDIRCLHAARASIVAYRIESTVFLRGAASVPSQITCSRCMEQVESDITSHLEMVLTRARERNRDEEEDVGLGIYHGEEIDLASICIENLGLNLPQILLCDAQCKGLCYICGANLNEKECDCRR